MSKRALILGGAGLIGSHLTLRLLAEGYDVVVIDKRSRYESPLLRNIDIPGRFHYIKHDITTPYQIGCDELYNLATSVDYGSSENYIWDQHLAAMGSINSLSNVIGNKTKVLYASSDDIYNFELPDAQYRSSAQFSSNARRFAESIHRAYHSAYNIEVRLARIFSTYGANTGLMEHHVIGRMITEAINNQDITIYGSGEQVRTFCWVEDMVDGLIALMRTHNSDGIMTADLGSATQITIREVAELIISLSGSSSAIKYVEARPEEPQYKVPNYKQTKKEINWKASTPLREGLLRMIRYIEKELNARNMGQISWIEIYG